MAGPAMALPTGVNLSRKDAELRLGFFMLLSDSGNVNYIL